MIPYIAAPWILWLWKNPRFLPHQFPSGIRRESRKGWAQMDLALEGSLWARHQRQVGYSWLITPSNHRMYIDILYIIYMYVCIYIYIWIYVYMIFIINQFVSYKLSDWPVQLGPHITPLLSQVSTIAWHGRHFQKTSRAELSWAQCSEAVWGCRSHSLETFRGTNPLIWWNPDIEW